MIHNSGGPAQNSQPLTPPSLVTHICTGKLDNHWFICWVCRYLAINFYCPSARSNWIIFSNHHLQGHLLIVLRENELTSPTGKSGWNPTCFNNVFILSQPSKTYLHDEEILTEEMENTFCICHPFKTLWNNTMFQICWDLLKSNVACVICSYILRSDYKNIMVTKFCQTGNYRQILLQTAQWHIPNIIRKVSDSLDMALI